MSQNSTEKTSSQSILEATKSRLSFSGHGRSLGAAGHRETHFDPNNCELLQSPGQSVAINAGENGFESIVIGAQWDNTAVKKAGFFERLLKKATNSGIDLDVGCLYELQDDTRGSLQAFGDKYGAFDGPPYITLSGDEKTGDAEGDDEYLLVNGKHWDKIKRILVYIYIYKGASNWREINPRLLIDVPGENDLAVTLSVHDDTLDLCAVGGLENIRGGIKLTNYSEYFPGHEEMDRAFGFGLQWADGKKS